MALNLGNLSAGVEIDSSKAVAEIQRLDKQISALSKSLQGVAGNKTNVDVTPKGGKQLDAAGKSATNLSKELDKAGRSASKLDARKAQDSLRGAAGEATKLESNVSNVAVAAKSMQLDKTMESGMRAIGAAADDAARGVSEVGGELSRVAGTNVGDTGMSNLSSQAASASSAMRDTASSTREVDGAAKQATSGMSKMLDVARQIAPAMTAVAGVGAVMTSGWKRLTELDTAQAKLRGLGYEAQAVEEIMSNAWQSVTGTSIAYAGAVTQASNAVATGVKQGEELTRVLTTMGDTATIAGVGIDEMGSIFTKVMTNGKLMTQEINQLQDRGIPVLQLLSDQLGVTTTEVQDMASEGAISFKTFETAMRSAFGGAAQEMGSQTLVGSIENIKAALANLGAQGLEPLKEMFITMANTGENALWALGSAVESVGAIFSAIPDSVIQFGLALGAVNGAAKLLNTEMGQKMVGHVSAAATAMGEFGKKLFTGQIGLKEFRSGIGSVIDALGGPLMIGITAATFVVGEMVAASKRASEAHAEMSAAANRLAEDQDTLRDALSRTNGVMEGEAVTAAQNWTATHLAAFRAVGLASEGVIKNYNKFIEDGLGVHEQRAAAEELKRMGDAWKELEGVTESYGLTYDELLNHMVQGTGTYGMIRTELMNMGDAGELAVKQLDETKRALRDQQDAAASASDTYPGVRDALMEVSEAAGDSEDRLDAVKKALQELGVIPDDTQRSLIETHEAIRELADGMTGLKDIETHDLFDGEIMLENLKVAHKGAGELYSSLEDIRDAGLSFRNEGMAWPEIFENIQPAIANLAESLGISEDQARALVEQIGLVPDEADLSFNMEGAHEAQAEIHGVLRSMEEIDGDKAEVEVTTLSDDAANALRELGAEVKELDNGNYKISIDGKEAIGKANEMLAKMDELDEKHVSPSAWLNSDMLNIGISDAKVLLHELDIQEPTPRAEFIIDNLLAGKGIAMGELDELGAQSPTPQADLNHTLLSMGVVTSTGEIAQLDKARATPKADLDDSAAKSKLSRLWDSLASFASRAFTATVNFVSGNAAGGIAGMIPALEVGGMLPAYAAGGAHYGNVGGGYQLPTAGPGTGGTDQILGVDRRGRPTAWVDRGEFIVNRNSTRDNLPALFAINNNDPEAAINALAAKLPEYGDLPQYAEGGKVSFDEALAYMRGQGVRGTRAGRSLEGAPYIWGGTDWGDCSGAVGQAARFVTQAGAYTTRFMATMNQDSALRGLGFRSGFGSGPRMVTGHFNGGPYGGHTSWTLFGHNGQQINGEMGGGRGNGQIGGAASPASHSQFTHHNWFPLSGGTAELARELNEIAADGGGRTADGATIASTSTDGVTLAYGDGRKESVDWGTAANLASEVESTMHRQRQLARWHNRDFDHGGIAQGVGWLPKNTLQPERVLPPSTTAALDEFLKQLPQATQDLAHAAQNVAAVSREHGIGAGSRGLAGELSYMVRTGDFRGNAFFEEDSVITDIALQMHDQFGNAWRAAHEMKASEWLDIGNELGLGAVTGLVSGVVQAQEKLDDMRVQQVDAHDALRQSEEKLGDARRHLAEVQGRDAAQTEAIAARVSNAEGRLREARRQGDPGRIEQAEKELAETREQAAADLRANGAAELSEVEQARDNVEQAEKDLAKANNVVAAAAAAIGRAEIALAVQVAKSVYTIGKKLYEFINDIVQHVRQTRVEYANILADAATPMYELSKAVEGARQSVAGMRVELMDMRRDIVTASWDVRSAQTDLMNAWMDGLRGAAEAQKSYDELQEEIFGKQHYLFDGLMEKHQDLRHELLNGIDEAIHKAGELYGLHADSLRKMLGYEKEYKRRTQDRVKDTLELWEIEGKNLDARLAGIAEMRNLSQEEARARIESELEFAGVADEGVRRRVSAVIAGLRRVADQSATDTADRIAQQENLNERETQLLHDIFQKRFANFDAEKATVEAQHDYTEAYWLAQRLGLEDAFKVATETHPELIAARNKVFQAEHAGIAGVHAAALRALDAMYNLQDATIQIQRASQDAKRGMAELAMLSGKAFGMEQGEAHLNQRIRQLQAQIAQYDKDIKDNRFGNFWDFNRDGKVFGIFDNKHSQRTQVAEAARSQAQKELAELNKLLKQRGGELRGLSERDKKLAGFGASLQARGESRLGEAALRGTATGEAESALNVFEMQKALNEIDQKRADLQRQIEDAHRREQRAKERIPHMEQQAFHQGMSDSYKMAAEAAVETNQKLRELLTEFSAIARERAGDNRGWFGRLAGGGELNAEIPEGIHRMFDLQAAKIADRINAGDSLRSSNITLNVAADDLITGAKVKQILEAAGEQEGIKRRVSLLERARDRVSQREVVRSRSTV
nr:MAG TPA: tail tape measure [Caudoviricetes sp.]